MGFNFYFLLGLAFYWNMRLDRWSDYKFTERSSPIEKQSFFRIRSVENSVLCKSMENRKTNPITKQLNFQPNFIKEQIQKWGKLWLHSNSLTFTVLIRMKSYKKTVVDEKIFHISYYVLKDFFP